MGNFSKEVAQSLEAYMVLSLGRQRRGQLVSDSKQRYLRRCLAFDLLERHYRQKQVVLEYARKRRHRRWHVRPIFRTRELFGAWYTLIPEMIESDHDSYFNFLRMTPASFDWLLEKTRVHLLKSSKRKSICPGERLAVTLRYLASGDSFTSLSYLFRISNECISNIVNETTFIIWLALRDVVFEELSEDFWIEKAAEFESMWNFPMCVGAMDGRHCFVQKFPMRGSEFYCYKDMNSIILFAVSDAKYKFIMVDVGARGRESDGGVFSRSEFGRMFHEKKLDLPHAVHRTDLKMSLPYVFVGDDAFPLHPNLMKPFDGYVTDQEEKIVYNYRLSRARRVVENAFGILSARFRILRKHIIGSETLAQNVILSCTALHNLHLMREDSIPPKQRVYLPQGFADVFKSNGVLKSGRWRREVRHLQGDIFNKLCQQKSASGNLNVASDIRDRFVSVFISNPVPWQWDLLPNI